MVINDRTDLLREPTYTIWNYYGVLPVYSGQLTTSEYAYDTQPEILCKKRPLAGGGLPGGPPAKDLTCPSMQGTWDQGGGYVCTRGYLLRLTLQDGC
jgi:hypothetical protein